MGTQTIYQEKAPRQLNDLHAKRHTASDAVFSELITVTMPQVQFLSNICNKVRLISMLSAKLESESFLVKQAMEDAEHLIVTSAIAAAEEHKYAVLVGEDIDLHLQH
ncbi:hypothetical protein AVEN_111881-1 [Araneus ventricosus]|uniref:Uncharacterized protein n=1 Tax=Araneus ventricosus TaxID=182803 RepID=A0A4Y2BX54_ARAVE|nr:hypothetical protein AVEN_111881-1 [Araneus ventricosus]